MIHYHGTPITPRAALLSMAGRHFCVSHAAPQDAKTVLSIAQSVLWDSGAFTAFTKGRQPVWREYYAWLESRLAPPHWAIVPDVIDGSIEEQRTLLAGWPFSRALGAPVWHIHLCVDYLLELIDTWPRVAFGSSGDFWNIRSDLWAARIDKAFNWICRHRRIVPWLHMLRGMDATSNGAWPFASADSTNVARNWKRNGATANAMALKIDAIQPRATHWAYAPEQMDMIK